MDCETRSREFVIKKSANAEDAAAQTIPNDEKSLGNGKFNFLFAIRS